MTNAPSQSEPDAIKQARDKGKCYDDWGDHTDWQF